MTDMTTRAGFTIDSRLASFLEAEVLGPLGRDVEAFWHRLAALLADFAPRNAALLAKREASTFGQDDNDIIVMPLKAFQRRISGNKNVQSSSVTFRDGAKAEDVTTQIQSLMRERRKLTENTEDDFNVMDTKQIAETLSGTIRTMTGLGLGTFRALGLAGFKEAGTKKTGSTHRHNRHNNINNRSNRCGQSVGAEGRCANSGGGKGSAHGIVQQTAQKPGRSGHRRCGADRSGLQASQRL